MQREIRFPLMRLSATLGLAALLGAAGCVTTSTAAPGAPSPAAGNSPPASERLVTGSRIPQPAVTQPALFTVTGEDLESSGRLDPAAALRSLLPVVR